jgi:hypothetical protein
MNSAIPSALRLALGGGAPGTGVAVQRISVAVTGQARSVDHLA